MTPRTYLITASTGIGAETARQLARLGHRLFIVSRTEENVRTLVAELQKLGAETSWHDGPLHECTEEGWHAVMEINVASQYRMCREALRVMLTQKPHSENGQRGVILNMASILGLHPEPKHFSAIAYAAGKGAIISMTRTAAAYYAKNKIRMNVIAPALVRTPMSARASEDRTILKFIAQKQPLEGGVIPVEDAAAVSVFLLTDGSRSITGEVLEVDAGWNLC